jgi:hypothetical protein
LFCVTAGFGVSPEEGFAVGGLVAGFSCFGPGGVCAVWVKAAVLTTSSRTNSDLIGFSSRGKRASLHEW